MKSFGELKFHHQKTGSVDSSNQNIHLKGQNEQSTLVNPSPLEIHSEDILFFLQVQVRMECQDRAKISSILVDQTRH